MPCQIILDTDMDTDCDDAGALAVLHALARRGECGILGVVCSLPFPECAAAVQAINHHAGFDLPVGRHTVTDYDQSQNWASYRAHRERYLAAFPQSPYNVSLMRKLAARPSVEDAVRLYRRLLAQAHDGSVIICAIGTLTALAALLRSSADDLSSLDGAALVGKRVRELVSMAAAPIPEGVERFNWKMDPAAAAFVLQHWPTPIAVSPAGDGILTGARFVAAAPAGHPVREAYVTFLGGEDRSRPSWDLIAALYAVRQLAGPFSLSEPLSLQFDAVTANYHWQAWRPGAPGRRLVTPRLDAAAMADALETLMLESLKRP